MAVKSRKTNQNNITVYSKHLLICVETSGLWQTKFMAGNSNTTKMEILQKE